MAINQHRDHAAVDQLRPAAILGVRQVFGDDMHAVLMPETLDMQAVGVVAAAAVANAIRGGSVLQRRGKPRHTLIILGNVFRPASRGHVIVFTLT